MEGFDPTGRGFPDDLMALRRALWERRRFAETLPAALHPRVVLRDAGGILHGPAAVAAAALEQVAGSPDQRQLGEDVIWTGSEALGHVGSMRTLVLGHDSHPGLFGAPTGAALRHRVMAEVYAKGGRISEIWQVTDTGAILRARGETPEAFARARLATLDPDTQPFTPEIDSPSAYTGAGTTDGWASAFADLLDGVMQGGFSAIPDQYDRACQVSYPGGAEAHGADAAEAFWLGLRAAFPSAEFAVHHRIGMEEPLLPPRAALRWSLTGRHEGFGPFGPPSGAQVHVMGLSHAEFGPRGLRREWTLFDETAVWLQIALGGG